MAWNKYFELKWTSSLAANLVDGQPAVVTRQYRLQLDEGLHATLRNLNGYTTNLLGQLMVVRVPFRPRAVEGVIRISPNDAAPWGSRAELQEAAHASDLEAKLWTDDAFWAAEWTGDWQPAHMDPMGIHWLAEIELRQKQ